MVSQTNLSGTPSLREVQSALKMILLEFDRVCELLGLRYFVVGGTALGAVRHHGFIPWDDDADVGLLRADYERFLAGAPELLNPGFSIQNSRTNELYPNMFSKLALDGTLFVSEQMTDNPYRMPIALDLFPFDVVAPTREAYRKQSRSTWFWGRLMYLQGTATPYLEIGGARRDLTLAATKAIHSVLIALGVGPRAIQARWERSARRYEKSNGYLFADFTDRHPLSWAATEDDLYPAEHMEFDGISVPVPKNCAELLTRGYGDYMELPPLEKRKTHDPAIVDLGPWEGRLG